MLNTFQFELRADLSTFVGSGTVVATNVGPDEQLVLLTVPADKEGAAFGRQEQKGYASFPNSRAEAAYPSTYFRLHRGKVIQEMKLSKVDIAFPFVAPLPNEEVLIAGARCQFKEDGPEKNGIVFDANGKVMRRFVLGDGIQSVQTTSEGMIWVSYFDEGVFGNYGWDKPMGGSGLNCFDATGKLLWQFTPPLGYDEICDCYALNVAQDAVWLCYYTDFPLVKIEPDKKVTGWRNKVGGVNALAVFSDRVLLWGGYGEKSNRCVLQTLRHGSLVNPRELSLLLPDRLSLKGVPLLGRESSLHAITNKAWFALKVEQLI